MTAKNTKTHTTGRAKAATEPNNTLKVVKEKDEADDLATARTILGPGFRHAIANSELLKALIGTSEHAPGFGPYVDAIEAKGDAAAKGELEFASRSLAAQAMTLDTIFAEMTRRMALNMGEYLAATETYARIAMKAQAQSRATLETLAKLHQPREQTVRHVHVNEGGQAVIADQFHNHTGGQGNSENDEQCHATGAAGESAALPSPNPLGNGVPIPGREREAAMQDARRD